MGNFISNRKLLATLGLLLPAVAFVPGCGDIVLPPGQGGETSSAGDASAANDTGGTATDDGGPGVDTGEGDSGETGEPQPGNCEDETQWAVEFLETNCAACHSPGGGAQGNFDYVTDIQRLLQTGKIVPGNPENSPMFARMELGEMPPPSSPQPNQSQIDRFRTWISDCSAAGVECEEQEFIDTRTVLGWMTEDLNTVQVDDRPFIRYFTLVHLYNAGFCAEGPKDQVQVYRDSLFKLVNALSSEPSITKPKPVGEHNLVFRIDIRDYGWDEPTDVDGIQFNDKWDALVGTLPYAVEYQEDEADVLKLFTETDVPFLMADAFVEAASQPPLYHSMANIPLTLQELELKLGINIAQNIAAEEVHRAGVLDSGVSQQNRVIERHEIPTAFGQAAWVSYDFGDDSQDEQNIFASPLDFVPAGGEVIFSLPNGMHAYMLVEANGDRLDVGPDFIVNDPNQKDQNVRNGVSCFTCHQTIIPAEDDVRNYVLNSSEFNIDVKDTVAALYTPVAEFKEIQAQDTTVFQNSLQAAGVRGDYEQEPILFTFLAFDQNIGLERAAAEVGLPVNVFLSQLGKLDPALQQLVNGSVKRAVWETKFPETICVLNIGLANSEECNNNEEETGTTGGSDGL